MYKLLLLFMTSVVGFQTLFASTCNKEMIDKKFLCNSLPVADCRWHVDAGLLLQQMRVSHAEVCSDMVATLQSDNQLLFRKDVKRLAFKLDPGLKIGMGFNFADDDLMFKANFEWICSKGVFNQEVFGTTVLNPTGTVLPSYVLSSAIPMAYQKVDASLDISYYLLELSIESGSYFSKSFSYKAFGGISSSWIYYNGNQNFSKDPVSGPDEMPEDTSWLRCSDVQFWGVGPMAGITGNYYLRFSGWSLFSTLNLAVLLGKSTVVDAEGFVTTQTYPISGDLVTDRNVVLCPLLRNLLGLQYDTDIYSATQHLCVTIGFDGRYYFNQNPIVENVAVATTATDGKTLFSIPNILDNSSFGMLGMTVDLGWFY